MYFQLIVALLCVFLASQQVIAVVNTGQTTKVEESSKSNASDETTQSETSAKSVTDSVAESTEEKANRRDASLNLGDTYGAPLPPSPQDTYLPTGPSLNLNLPVPVYGVPDAPSNNVVYAPPPPDIPPPISNPSPTYGLPQIDVPKDTYGPPSSHNFGGSLSNSYGPPPIKYGVPSLSPPPKQFFPGPSRLKAPKPIYGLPPRPQYGPPKPLFTQKLPKHPIKHNFGFRPPKPTYGAPDFHFKDTFSSSKLNFNSNFLQNSFSSHSSHSNQQISTQYGAPNAGTLSPTLHYGPPEPVAHPKPPHPGAPAPPTPPDIKYDGWQPIPGLVSKVPSDTYGVPPSDHHPVGDLSYNNDLSPPPLEGGSSSGGHGGSSLSISNSYGPPNGGLSDSYGAPLNTVTGSGGVIISSGEESHSGHSGALSLGGIGQGHSVQAVKSISYEIFPNDNSGGGGNVHGSGDTYSAPPLDSYSADGPYAASHSYNSNGQGQKDLSLSSTGIGLIPPSGVYGVPPSGQYGAPLFTPTSQLNALAINPPKRPVLLREPVPAGLIDTIGKHSAQKEIFGSSNFNLGQAYLPPPVSDLPLKNDIPPEPTNLYSLPSSNSPISFQNLVHGSSSAGLHTSVYNSGFSSGSLNLEGASAQALSSYNVPLGTVDGSYSVPSHLGLTVGLDHSLPPVSIDLTGGYSQTNTFSLPHDCALHKTQALSSLAYSSVPSVPSVPTVSEYNSLSSGSDTVNGQASVVPDLNTAHSQTVSTEARNNNIEESDKDGKEYGKSVAQSFGPNSELIKSQSINLNNIPLQGNLGSYTLQIQAADSSGEQNRVPHTQVLNDGLLQSILAAIEQPQQQQQNIPVVGLPIYQLPPNFKQAYFTNSTENSENTNTDKQNLADYEVIEKQSNDSDEEEPLSLLNNEIALYFSNNQQRHKKDTESKSEESTERIDSTEKSTVNGH